jgi:hypothetical protein
MDGSLHLKTNHRIMVRIHASSNLYSLLTSVGADGRDGDAICVLKALAIIGSKLGFSPSPKRVKIIRSKSSVAYRVHTHDPMSYEQVLGYAEKAWARLNLEPVERMAAQIIPAIDTQDADLDKQLRRHLPSRRDEVCVELAYSWQSTGFFKEVGLLKWFI